MTNAASSRVESGPDACYRLICLPSQEWSQGKVCKVASKSRGLLMELGLKGCAGSWVNMCLGMSQILHTETASPSIEKTARNKVMKQCLQTRNLRWFHRSHAFFPAQLA